MFCSVSGFLLDGQTRDARKVCAKPRFWCFVFFHGLFAVSDALHCYRTYLHRSFLHCGLGAGAIWMYKRSVRRVKKQHKTHRALVKFLTKVTKIEQGFKSTGRRMFARIHKTVHDKPCFVMAETHTRVVSQSLTHSSCLSQD